MFTNNYDFVSFSDGNRRYTIPKHQIRMITSDFFIKHRYSADINENDPSNFINAREEIIVVEEVNILLLKKKDPISTSIETIVSTITMPVHESLPYVQLSEQKRDKFDLRVKNGREFLIRKNSLHTTVTEVSEEEEYNTNVVDEITEAEIEKHNKRIAALQDTLSYTTENVPLQNWLESASSHPDFDNLMNKIAKVINGSSNLDKK
jgi:hypothetical protein